jgi:hypothetical protein
MDYDPTMFEPGSFGCHEAYHMAFVLIRMIEHGLCEHPAIEAEPEWQRMASIAREQLLVLYKSIGKQHMNEVYQKRAVNYYQNDFFEERACDHCGNPYRGPAVYCSLACAQADA